MVDTTAIAPFLDAHKANIASFKAVDSRLAAVEGDRDKAVQAWMESSDDETAVKLREAVQEATRRLKVLAEQNVTSEDMSETDKDKLKVERGELREKLLAGSRSLRKLIEAFGLDLDATEVLKEMGDPTVRRGSSTESSGSGLPRASVTVHIFKKGEPGQAWDLENLGKTASLVDLPVEEMQKLYAEAGGVAHEDIKSIKTPLEFEYQNPTTKTVWVIQTTPKETAPRGRKAVTPKDPNELPPKQESAA